MRPRPLHPIHVIAPPAGRMWRLLIVPAAAMLLAAAGCSVSAPAVKPYERGGLEDPIMTRERDPLAATYTRHVHECTEGARGGSAGVGTSQSCH